MLKLENVKLTKEITNELLRKGYEFSIQNKTYSYYVLNVCLDGINGISGSVEVQVIKDGGISIYTNIILHNNVCIDYYCRLSIKIDVEVTNLLLMLGC